LACYRPWSAFRTPETFLSRLDCDQCSFYKAGQKFALATDDIPRENRHDLCRILNEGPPAFDLLLSISLVEKMVPGDEKMVPGAELIHLDCADTDDAAFPGENSG